MSIIIRELPGGGMTSYPEKCVYAKMKGTERRGVRSEQQRGDGGGVALRRLAVV